MFEVAKHYWPKQILVKNFLLLISLTIKYFLQLWNINATDIKSLILNEILILLVSVVSLRWLTTPTSVFC